MKKPREVFTTGQVSKICKVAPRTVVQWFNKGLLRGYRIPGSQDRRIPRANLVAFLKAHGMPLGDLEDGETTRVLLVGLEPDAATAITTRLTARATGDRHIPPFRVEIAANGFDAGILAEASRPQVVVASLSLGRGEGLAIAAALRRNEAYSGTRLVAVANDDEVAFDELATAFDGGIVRRPVDPVAVVGLVIDLAEAALAGRA